MKAITVRQPWANLIAIGTKKIETRSWSTQYRGPIAIHAAKKYPESAQNLFTNDGAFFVTLRGLVPRKDGHIQPLEILKLLQDNCGKVLATAELVECWPTEKILPHISALEEALGDYSPGRFGFFLRDIKVITPVPAKGALSLWEWDGGL